MTDREIFLAVLDLPDAAVRTDYLDRVCSGDLARRARIESLLLSHDTADSFLDCPAVMPPQRHELATEVIDSVATPDDENEVDDALGFLQPSTRPDSLGRLGHYEILEVLGKGGFGTVFRAFDETLQRVVAIKVLSAPIAATSPARKRFLREARSSAKVRHENIVQVYAVEEQPLPYLVMEFIPGETLQQRLDRTGPLETAEVLQMGRQIAKGLAAAHSAGLIHRDIKPGNILIEAGPHPRVKITDFGLARAADDASMSQSGTVAGTPMFMSPEQARGDTLDHRADLFSFGSVLYTMCSGRPPFRANTMLAVLKRVAEDTPRPISEIIPEVPQWLCDIITRLHAKNPADRFSRAQEVADLLAKGLEDLRSDGTRGALPLAARPAPDTAEPTVPRTPDPGETVALPPRIRPRFAGRRHRVVAASLLLTLLAGLGLAEASGVSNVRGVVVRLFFPDGTLVVEVDDPGVSVRIDGSDLVITGTGVKELRVKPGDYRVVASKDGRVVQQELVRVERNGRRVIRVAREAVPAAVPDKGLEPLNRKPAAEALAASVFPGRASADDIKPFDDEKYGFALQVPAPWAEAPLSQYTVPGLVRAAWSGPAGSSIVAFVQEPGKAFSPRFLVDVSAKEMKEQLGCTVKVAEVKTVDGKKAMWLVATGPGTGGALAREGAVETSSHWVAISRQKDIVVILLTCPAADYDERLPSFEAVIKTMKVKGEQTPEQAEAK